MNTQRNTVANGNGAAIRLDEILAQQEIKRAIPARITQEDYAKAIGRLIDLAFKGCGGSRAAAQVLLSLYNGDNYHVDLTDLCVLDINYFRDCITAIRGRYECNREPHEMIANGDRVFEQLQAEWQQYHVNNRYKERYD